MKQIVPKFTNAGNFTTEVKNVVYEYFRSHGISEKGDWRLYQKTIVLFSLFFALYFFIVGMAPPWWLKLFAVVLLGRYILPGIGFCVMHDALHGSYSKKAWINTLAGLSLNFLGANDTLWKTKHNIIHHTHTNIDGFDEDIETAERLRLHEEQPWRPRHRHQHKWWYWRFFYSLLYLQWVWWNDYKKYFTRRILYKSPIAFSPGEHALFWMSKVVHILLFVVVPMYTLGLWQWVIGYSVMSLSCGLKIATVFQLAHSVSETQHPSAAAVHKTEWFRHQVATTADFAVENSVLSWWVGGLNFQIEHHLFPGFSHIHYPVIHRLIKPICQKHGVQMIVHNTMHEALASHVRFLKLLGRKPV